MPRIRLSEAKLKNIKPPRTGRTEYTDQILPGLVFRITQTGLKSWSLLFRIAGEGGESPTGYPLRGRLRRITFGPYPLIPLAEAREKAREALEQADRGHNPLEARRLEIAKTQRLREVTFQSVAEEFLEGHRKKNNKPNTYREAKSTLDRLVFPVIGAKPITEISRHELSALIDELSNSPRPHASIKALKEIKGVFKWAIERELIQDSPAVKIRSPIKGVSRDRVLSDSEIKAIWKACEEIGYPYGTMTQMLLLTAQRRREVSQAQWSDLNLKTKLWTIAQEQTKSNRSHEVPLSSAVIDILKPNKASKGYIFTTTKGIKPINGFSKSKKRIDRISGVTEWRYHDLRRTAASGLAKLGTPVNVIAKILNHSGDAAHGGVTGIYNRYGYDNEKRMALENFSLNIMRIVN